MLRQRMKRKKNAVNNRIVINSINKQKHNKQKYYIMNKVGQLETNNKLYKSQQNEQRVKSG